MLVLSFGLQKKPTLQYAILYCPHVPQIFIWVQPEPLLPD